MLWSLHILPITGKHLKEIKSLHVLHLAGTQVTDAGLKELAPLKNLAQLHLQETQVTDAGLKELAPFTNLASLNLDGTKVTDAGLDWANVDKSRVGIYVGLTEHGNVETENEVYALKGYDYDTQFWSHHHNPRTVANSPAGEVTLSLGVTGPHYTLGAACAAGPGGVEGPGPLPIRHHRPRTPTSALLV